MSRDAVVTSRARPFARAVLLVVSIVVAAAILEGVLRFHPLDARLLEPLLYYQCADVEVHEVSDDPSVLYHLKPGASRRYGDRVVTVNRFGFRDPERTREKPPGTFRIIVYGGSNAYGAVVGDDETYPAYLEKELNRAYPDHRFEVWNGGVSAYMLSQELGLARVAMREYAPDLIFFGPTNTGRRALLQGTDIGTYFRRYPSLYRENLQFYPGVDTAVGPYLLEHSAAWRTLVIAINRLLPTPSDSPAEPPNTLNPHYGDPDLDAREFVRFYEEFHSKVAIVQAGAPRGLSNYRERGMDVPMVNLFDPKRLPPEGDASWLVVHPPAYVYAWYARVLTEDLSRLGVIPTGQ